MNNIYDLSHTVDENTYHPLGAASFTNREMFVSHGCRHAFVTMSLHFGTHIDAPWHMVEDGITLDKMSIRDLVGPALILDVSDRYGPEGNGERKISREDLERTLLSHNLKVETGDALIVHTGWAALFQSEPIRYYKSYPTLGEEASRWLIEKGIRLIGLDVPDLDLPESYSQAPYKPVNHRLILGSGIYIIENVGGEITSVLNRRINIIPAAVNFGGEFASGAPVRLLAMT